MTGALKAGGAFTADRLIIANGGLSVPAALGSFSTVQANGPLIFNGLTTLEGASAVGALAGVLLTANDDLNSIRNGNFQQDLRVDGTSTAANVAITALDVQTLTVQGIITAPSMSWVEWISMEVRAFGCPIYPDQCAYNLAPTTGHYDKYGFTFYYTRS